MVALRNALVSFALAGLLCGPGGVAAESAGQVLFAKGAVSAQQTGDAPRFLGRGVEVQTEDVITAASRSFAVLQLHDGTRVVVRPDTVIALEQFSHAADQPAANESVVLRLFRGGLRALSGLISRRNPNGFQIRTVTATIGVRGTELDARLCQQDCAAEQQALQRDGDAGEAEVVGRIGFLKGVLNIQRPGAETKSVQQGAPVYKDDFLNTGITGFAVVVFRDGSRVTLQAGSRLMVEEYVDQAADTESLSVVLRLLRGGMRALSGLVVKRRAGAFKVRTPMAVMTVRGTGLDLLCDDRCAAGDVLAVPLQAPAGGVPACSGRSAPSGSGGLYAGVWQGGITLRSRICELDVDLDDSALALGPDQEVVRIQPRQDLFQDDETPRPDSVDIDAEALFARVERGFDAPGLYAHVYDGHVTMTQSTRSLELGGGESGYANPEGTELIRLAGVPWFLLEDTTPRPSEFTLEGQSVIDLISASDPPLRQTQFECLVR